MELMNSAINETWKLCTIGGFLGFFVLAVFLTTSPQNVEISTARSSTVITFVSTTTETATTAQQLDTTHVNLVNSTVSASTPLSGAENNSSFARGSSSSNTSLFPSGITTTTSTTSAAAAPSSSVLLTQGQPPLPAKDLLTPGQPPLPTIDRVYDLDNAAEVAADAITTTPTVTREDEEGELEKKKQEEEQRRCNIFEGRWVYRPSVSPMYSVYQCPFLEDKMSCRRNGRPDSDYEGWSWEPNECDIPLFNGKDMLERMRGKRMMIAGDSLNRNMWESLACLLYSSISDPDRVLIDAAGSMYKLLKAKDYDFTLEFYWCPFLVDLENKHRTGKKVLHLDKLVPSSKQWIGADVMVFDSGHWWTHRDKWDVFQLSGKTIPDMPIETAYELGLTTWKKWIAANVNPQKTSVFFRSISPEHKGKQWCFNATKPIQDESYINIYPKSMIRVVESTVGARKEEEEDKTASIRYLNITRLSGYRRDAHPSMYRYEEWKWKVLTAKYMRLVPQQADCSHWCLPGLPDTWNRLLYVSLFYYGEDGRARSN